MQMSNVKIIIVFRRLWRTSTHDLRVSVQQIGLCLLKYLYIYYCFHAIRVLSVVYVCGPKEVRRILFSNALKTYPRVNYMTYASDTSNAIYVCAHYLLIVTSRTFLANP